MHPQLAIFALHCMMVLCSCFITKFPPKFCNHTILDTLVMNEEISLFNYNNNWKIKTDNNNNNNNNNNSNNSNSI